MSSAAESKLLHGFNVIDVSLLQNKRVALISNHTAVDKRGNSTLKLLLEKNVNVTLLFSLEHGFFPVAQDMESVAEKETIENIPVCSLYGDSFSSLSPDASVFSKFDVVLYDVQDVGSRYYTYVQSLTIFMDVLQKKGKVPLFIADRINPIDGITVEGAWSEDAYHSFVGRFPMLHRHGMTTAELADYYYRLNSYTFPIHYFKIEGWDRNTYFDDHDYPWLPLSPNMPTLDAAVAYPGGCLVEGTNISEGRGTTTPFLLKGFKGLNSFRLKEKCDELNIDGAVFMPLDFRPMFQKCSMEHCGGIYMHINDRKLFKPVRAYIKILNLFREFIKDEEFFRKKAYEFVTNIPAIELLLANEKLIELFYKKAPFDEIDSFLSENEKDFAEHRKYFLFY